jgi:hypothetical protein
MKTMVREAMDRSTRPTNWSYIIGAISLAVLIASGYTTLALQPIRQNQTQFYDYTVKQFDRELERAEQWGRQGALNEMAVIGHGLTGELSDRLSALESEVNALSYSQRHQE